MTCFFLVEKKLHFGTLTTKSSGLQVKSKKEKKKKGPLLVVILFTLNFQFPHFPFTIIFLFLSNFPPLPWLSFPGRSATFPSEKLWAALYHHLLHHRDC